MNDTLFKPQLGCCNTFKVTLSLRDGAQPKYCKVRKLPFALKPAVGAELDRLEKEQVLEKVRLGHSPGSSQEAWRQSGFVVTSKSCLILP